MWSWYILRTMCLSLWLLHRSHTKCLFGWNFQICCCWICCAVSVWRQHKEPRLHRKTQNSTQDKSQTHRAKQYEVTSFLSTDYELSTETCSKNVYSLGPRRPLQVFYILKFPTSSSQTRFTLIESHVLRQTWHPLFTMKTACNGSILGCDQRNV